VQRVARDRVDVRADERATGAGGDWPGFALVPAHEAARIHPTGALPCLAVWLHEHYGAAALHAYYQELGLEEP
jgi:hypothetical protein